MADGSSKFKRDDSSLVYSTMCVTQWAHGTGRCHYHYYSDVGTPSPPQPQPDTVLCQQQNDLFQTRASILVLHRTDSCPRTDSKSTRLLGERGGDNCFGPHTPFLMSLGGIWSLSWLFYSVNHWAGGILELAFFPPFFFIFFLITNFGSCLEMRNLEGVFVTYGFALGVCVFLKSNVNQILVNQILF